jgi:hypothetical protein
MVPPTSHPAFPQYWNIIREIEILEGRSSIWLNGVYLSLGSSEGHMCVCCRWQGDCTMAGSICRQERHEAGRMTRTHSWLRDRIRAWIVRKWMLSARHRCRHRSKVMTHRKRCDDDIFVCECLLASKKHRFLGSEPNPPLTLLAAGYVSVRNNIEEPCLVSSDEWFLGKYSPFSCKIFPRDIFFHAIYHLEIIIRCHGTRLYNCVSKKNITGCQQCEPCFNLECCARGYCYTSRWCNGSTCRNS